MKVIHISRKQKIKRTSYEWYRAKNKIKSGFHKVGAFSVALALAIIVGVSAQIFSMYMGCENSALIGLISFTISFLASMAIALYSHKSKTVLFWGILAVTTFNCNYGLGNTGTDCTPNLGAPKKMFAMNYYNAAGTQNRIALVTPGTITCTASSATLTGTGTTFLTTFTVGDLVVITGNAQSFYVSAISSNTSMTATVVATASSTTTTYNQISNTAFWVALVNHIDRTRAVYPIPFVKNANSVRADNIMQTFDDNTEESIMQNVRKIMGLIPKTAASPQLKGKLDTFAANNALGLGMYMLDYANNFHISDILDGFAYPIRIDENSWRAIYNPGEIKTGAKIDIMCNVHSNEVDSTLNAIAASNFGTVNLGNLNGLKDASVVYSNLSHSANDLTLTLTTIYGDAITTGQVHGLSPANFISKVTGASGKIACTGGTDIGTDLAVTACVEQTDINGKPNGVFVLTITSPLATDVLSPNIQMNGIDFSAVNVSTVTLT